MVDTAKWAASLRNDECARWLCFVPALPRPTSFTRPSGLTATHAKDGLTPEFCFRRKDPSQTEGNSGSSETNLRAPRARHWGNSAPNRAATLTPSQLHMISIRSRLANCDCISTASTSPHPDEDGSGGSSPSRDSEEARSGAWTMAMDSLAMCTDVITASICATHAVWDTSTRTTTRRSQLLWLKSIAGKRSGGGQVKSQKSLLRTWTRTR